MWCDGNQRCLSNTQSIFGLSRCIYLQTSQFFKFFLVLFVYNSGFCSFTSLGCATRVFGYDRDQIFSIPLTIALILSNCIYLLLLQSSSRFYLIKLYLLIMGSLSPQSFCLGFGSLYFLLVILHQLRTCIEYIFL